LDDPNEIFILLEWDTKEHATNFVESEELRKIMKKAGVITKPEIRFFEKIEDFSL
jgi:heme-degrading monooxygenase HmoA